MAVWVGGYLPHFLCHVDVLSFHEESRSFIGLLFIDPLKSPIIIQLLTVKFMTAQEK